MRKKMAAISQLFEEKKLNISGDWLKGLKGVIINV